MNGPDLELLKSRIDTDEDLPALVKEFITETKPIVLPVACWDGCPNNCTCTCDKGCKCGCAVNCSCSKTR